MDFRKTMKKIVLFVPVLLFVAIVLFWLWLYPGHLYFWEESDFFQMTTAFFRDYVVRPGGLSDYWGCFLTLLFRWKIVGAVCMVLPLCLVYVSMRRMLNVLQIARLNAMWVWMPIVLLFILQSQESFGLGESLKVAFVFVVAALYLSLSRARIRYMAFLLFTPALSLLISSGAFFFLWGVAVLYECGWQRNRNRYLFLSLWLVEGIILPIFRQRYFLLLPDDDLFRLSAFEPESSVAWQVWALFLWLPLTVVASFFEGVRQGSGRFVENSIAVLIPAVIFVFLFPYRTTRSAEMLMRADEALQHRKWTEIIELSQQENVFTQEITFLRALALSQTGRLPQELFDAPVFGLADISPTMDYNYRRNIFAAEYYACLGIYNEAVHRFFQASADSPRVIDLRTLKGLIANNIKCGFFRRAEKYISILKLVPFQDKSVKMFQEELYRFRESNPNYESNDFFVGGWISTVELAQLVDIQKDNQMARDYLLCGLLLQKDLSRFARILPIFYPADPKKPLPKAYEEAVLWLAKTGTPGLDAYPIHPQTRRRYDVFMSILRNKLLPEEQQEHAAAPFQDSWWYYAHFRGMVVSDEQGHQLNVYD